MRFSDLETPGSHLSSQDCRLEPAVRLLRFYRDSHLLSASDTLICPTAESELSSILPVLDSVSQSNLKVGCLTGDRQDEEAEWWSNLLRCGALWCANNLPGAQLTYPEIDRLPVHYQVGPQSDSLYCMTELCAAARWPGAGLAASLCQPGNRNTNNNISSGDKPAGLRHSPGRPDDPQSGAGRGERGGARPLRPGLGVP